MPPKKRHGGSAAKATAAAAAKRAQARAAALDHAPAELAESAALDAEASCSGARADEAGVGARACGLTLNSLLGHIC